MIDIIDKQFKSRNNFLTIFYKPKRIYIIVCMCAHVNKTNTKIQNIRYYALTFYYLDYYLRNTYYF